MLEILPAPAHVIAYRLSGRLTSEEYDRIIADVEAKLAANSVVHVFADAVDFEDITPEALAKDFTYAFGKIAEWPRFRRVALVSDKGWMKAMVRLFDPLIPGVDARTYDAGQQAEAMDWVSAPPVA